MSSLSSYWHFLLNLQCEDTNNFQQFRWLGWWSGHAWWLFTLPEASKASSGQQDCGLKWGMGSMLTMATTTTCGLLSALIFASRQARKARFGSPRGLPFLFPEVGDRDRVFRLDAAAR